MWKLKFHDKSDFDLLRPASLLAPRLSSLAARSICCRRDHRSHPLSGGYCLQPTRYALRSSHFATIQDPCQLRIRGFAKRSVARADSSATMQTRIWRNPRIRRGTKIESEGATPTSLLALQLLHGEPCISNFKFEISNLNCGGWIRTSDLRVMSPASYQTALPREDHLQVKDLNLHFGGGTPACFPIALTRIRSEAVMVTTSDLRTPVLDPKTKTAR